MTNYYFHNEIFETLTDAQDAAFATALNLYHKIAEEAFGRDVLNENPHNSKNISICEVERQETMLNEFIDSMFSEIVEVDASEAANLVA